VTRTGLAIFHVACVKLKLILPLQTDVLQLHQVM